MLQVAKNNALNGNRCGSDCAGPKEAGQQAERQASEAAKPVAAAAGVTAALKLFPKDSAVPQLVRPKLRKLSHKSRRREAREKDLPGVDVDRAVLARVIDLDDAVA